MQKNKEEGNLLHARTLVITGVVSRPAAASSRSSSDEFRAIGALALFAGAYFSNKREALRFHCCH